MKRLLLSLVLLMSFIGVTKVYSLEKLAGQVIVADGSMENITQDMLIEVVKLFAEKHNIKIVDDYEIKVIVYMNIFYTSKFDMYGGYIRASICYPIDIDVKLPDSGIVIDGQKYVVLSYSDTSTVCETTSQVKGVIGSFLNTFLKYYKDLNSEETF